ncbi:MAG: hypothetical protein GXX84_12890 [Acidobacteria bacterium]|nr:hypothetical protein [Acidobacteriota bacterium]
MNQRFANRIVFWLTGAVLTAAAVAAIPDAREKEIPEYTGSQACMGCHTGQHSLWKSSDHAHMVVPVINATDLPLDISEAPAELQAELRKASYIVAGTFFIDRDDKTQHYKLLSVIYDKEAKAYKPSDVALTWSTDCAGCHTTNMNTAALKWGEPGIGCEACHGPGRDHILGKGDKSKIVKTKQADVCGQCHGGNDARTGAKLMADGTKWIVGYRPGMKLSDLKGVQFTPVDPEKTPPDPALTEAHLRNYNMWAASRHAHALDRIATSKFAGAECYGCHTAEGLAAKQQGVKLAGKETFNTITCVACHDPHNSENPHQLVSAPQDLCNACHTQDGVVKGRAAKGVEASASMHSGFDCIQCHMTESNHLMKVIRPDAPDLAEQRLDTCSTCHTNKSKKESAAQLQNWQASFTKKMDGLQSDLKEISAALKEKPDALNADLKAKLSTARADISILTRDKSRGAHNFDYAMKIMDKAGKDLEAVKRAIK